MQVSVDRITDDQLEPLDTYIRHSGLTPDERAVLAEFVQHLDRHDHEIRVGEIVRGLGGGRKIALKPDGLFAFIVKLGDADSIAQEIAGDQLVRLRTPPTFVPDLVWSHTFGPTGAIVYRYLTRGRVSEPPDRMDVWMTRVTRDRALRFLHLLFETGLKKMHWVDGKFVLIEAPPPPLLRHGVTSARRVEEAYRTEAVSRLVGIGSPHGVIHGDLHPKNILVDIGEKPILIDFPMAAAQAPIVLDFVRMEAHMLLQTVSRNQHSGGRDDDYSLEGILGILDRLYRPGELILPRSARPLPSMIHEIRCSFWRGCLSRTAGMSPDDVDNVYSTYLAAEFGRFLSKRNVDNLDGASTLGEQLAFACFSALVGQPCHPRPEDLGRAATSAASGSLGL